MNFREVSLVVQGGGSGDEARSRTRGSSCERGPPGRLQRPLPKRERERRGVAGLSDRDQGTEKDSLQSRPP